MNLVQGAAVSVLVADLDRAVRFYTHGLGATLRRREGDCAEVDLPGVRLRLSRAPEPGPDAGHAFPVSIALDVERLDGAMLVLRDRGIRFAPGIAEREGERVAFFTDDDGTPLYLRESRTSKEEGGR